MRDSSITTRRFTVMELAVIVVIMLTLMSVLIPVINGAQKRQNQANCLNQQMEIGVATADWLETHDGYLPMAKSISGMWFEQLRTLESKQTLRLTCAANSGQLSAESAINYGWNSYLGDLDLTDSPQQVRSGWIERPAEILLAGDGTATGEQTAQGVPTVWGQKTWRKESAQAFSTEPIHGKTLNYLFADLHVAPISLDDPYLIGNPAGVPANNYWVELVNPAPGPFFKAPKE